MGLLNVEFRDPSDGWMSLKDLSTGEVFHHGSTCYIATDEWVDHPEAGRHRSCVDITYRVGHIFHLSGGVQVIPVEASLVIEK